MYERYLLFNDLKYQTIHIYFAHLLVLVHIWLRMKNLAVCFIGEGHSEYIPVALYYFLVGVIEFEDYLFRFSVFRGNNGVRRWTIWVDLLGITDISFHVTIIDAISYLFHLILRFSVVSMYSNFYIMKTLFKSTHQWF